MSHRTAFLLGVLAALAIPTSAIAATPSSGTISPSAKKTTATGTITDPFGSYDLVMFFNGGTTVRGNDTCTAPACETFTLTVASGGKELRIIADAPASANVSMDITDPSGAHYSHNTADYFPNRTFLGFADPGTWKINVYGTPELDSFDYTLSAEMNLPGSPAFVPPNDGSDATG